MNCKRAASLDFRVRGARQVQIGHSVARGAGPSKFRVVNRETLWQVSSSQFNREFEMSLKKASLVAMLAVSMASTPVLAQTATSASSLSASQARSGAELSGESEVRGGFLIPAIAIIAVILGILAAVGGDNDRPTSP